MTNNTATASEEPQAGPTGDPQPQAGATTTTEPQAGESQSTKSQKSADDYERLLSELRKENAAHRTRLKKFEEEESKRAEAQLSEQQKLEKRLAEIQAQHDETVKAHTERIIDLEVRAQAAQLGINPKHLDKVARFLDWSEIEVDEAGNPTNVKDVLTQLIKDMPELLGKGSAAPTAPTSGGATNPSRTASQQPPELSWAVIGQMTPDQYNARRGEIQQWMLKNPPRFR